MRLRFATELSRGLFFCHITGRVGLSGFWWRHETHDAGMTDVAHKSLYVICPCHLWRETHSIPLTNTHIHHSLIQYPLNKKTIHYQCVIKIQVYASLIMLIGWSDYWKCVPGSWVNNWATSRYTVRQLENYELQHMKGCKVVNWYMFYGYRWCMTYTQTITANEMCINFWNETQFKNSTQNLLDYNLQLDGCTVTSSTVTNLGVILDSNLSFENHISNVTKTAFFHLRNIAKLRNMLSVSDAEKLVHAF